MFAPVASIVGYEAVGHRHQAEALAQDEEGSSGSPVSSGAD